MTRTFLLLFFNCAFASATVTAQSISGTFPLLANEEVRLEGFRGFETYTISRTNTDANGTFSLSYIQDDIGMGYLISSDNRSFVVVLSGENIELKGEAFGMPESIKILAGPENLLFDQYASEHPRREQALSAWIYLENIYRMDSLFTVHEIPLLAILEEKERIRREDQSFLADLDPNSYIHWYLPLRKLLSSVPVVAQFRTEEIPAAIQSFRELDYADQRLYKSGLLGDVIESHVWLIENSGRSLDSVFVELNVSTDILIENLASNPFYFNETAEYLFDLLQERSLFESAEHLALNLLTNNAGLLNSRLINKLEVYRAMKIGSTAPDIVFMEATLNPGRLSATRLSEIESDYILVIFAAGWCPHCQDMAPELKSKALTWQRHGVEIVLVSLDNTPESFNRFASDFSFISTTDYQRWNSPIAKDYHVSGVPTMYLLNRDREILLRPNSVQHMDSWVDWFLVQGNR